MSKTITIESGYSNEGPVTITAEQMMENLTKCAKDSHGNPLPCSGCGHSASSKPFPGSPSGERPCCFCVRNVKREEWLADMTKSDPAFGEKYGKTWTCFYNNKPMRQVPMDCYISTDRIMNDVPAGSVVFG